MRRGMRRAAVGLLVVAPLAMSGIAHASTTTVWAGNGSDNLPCADGGHWVLSPAQGITAATLTVDGIDYTMQKNGNNGSWAADSGGPLTGSTTASATYDGNNSVAFLKLSHCAEGPPPPPPPL